LELIECLGGAVGIELLVAGRIHTEMEGTGLPPNVKILGQIYDIAGFYGSCHVAVNPDTFDSGMKTKSVEALAHDMPLVCTVSASKGLGATAPFHLSKSAQECATFLLGIVNNPAQLRQVHEESRHLYQGFVQRYPDNSCSSILSHLR